MPVVSMLSGKIIKAEGNSNGGQLTLEISGKRSIVQIGPNDVLRLTQEAKRLWGDKATLQRFAHQQFELAA